LLQEFEAESVEKQSSYYAPCDNRYRNQSRNVSQEDEEADLQNLRAAEKLIGQYKSSLYQLCNEAGALHSKAIENVNEVREALHKLGWKWYTVMFNSNCLQQFARGAMTDYGFEVLLDLFKSSCRSLYLFWLV
jgi:hypothetical protein